MAEATENTQNNAWLEQMINSKNEISEEETLLLSLSLADNNAVEIESEMDLAIKLKTYIHTIFITHFFFVDSRMYNRLFMC